MKTTLFALLSLITIAGTAAAQQQQQTDSTPPGQGWIKLNTGTTAGFSSVDPHGSDTVYTSGNAFLRSIDGGDTWQTMGSTPVASGTLHFINDTTGFIVSGQQVYKTINGGQTWNDTTLDIAGASANAILFRGDTGWVAGHFVCRTTDGGKVWHQENGMGENDDCIAFAPDGQHGYMLGVAQSWHWRTDIGDVSFTAPDFLRTTDGGVNWEDLYYDSLFVPQRSDTKGYTFIPWGVLGIAAPSERTIIAVGVGIAKSTDGGDNWDTILTSAINLYAVCFSDSMHGTTVGGDGLIMHTTDGGESWQTQNSGLTSQALYSVQFMDSLNGFASGSQGVVIKTTNGGLSWVRISLQSNQIQGGTYPNPSNEGTTLSYSLPSAQRVNLNLQSMTGATVQTPLTQSFQSQGDQSVPIDTSTLASGIYTYTLRTDKYFATGKIEVIH